MISCRRCTQSRIQSIIGGYGLRVGNVLPIRLYNGVSFLIRPIINVTRYYGTQNNTRIIEDRYAIIVSA